MEFPMLEISIGAGLAVGVPLAGWTISRAINKVGDQFTKAATEIHAALNLVTGMSGTLDVLAETAQKSQDEVHDLWEQHRDPDNHGFGTIYLVKLVERLDATHNRLIDLIVHYMRQQGVSEPEPRVKRYGYQEDDNK